MRARYAEKICGGNGGMRHGDVDMILPFREAHMSVGVALFAAGEEAARFFRRGAILPGAGQIFLQPVGGRGDNGAPP